MSARPCFRVLVRARQRYSGETHLWVIDRDGSALFLVSFRRSLGGAMLVRFAEPLR